MQVAVIGGGQAGLATGFYLRRAGLVPGKDFVIIDAAQQPGGAWPQTWEGLRLFSPSSFSSLPGWMMPAWNDARHGFPPRQHVIDYLSAYEQRYDLAPVRPHRVDSVRSVDDDLAGPLLVTGRGLEVSARVVVSATGTWDQPFWPAYPGAGDYGGQQLHTADYRTPAEFEGRRVAVVGGGNSAAQILAEISGVTSTLWVTQHPPRFLPDDVDGRALFAAATRRVQAQRQGRHDSGVGGLGDIVMVESVKGARARGALAARAMFTSLTKTGLRWHSGEEEAVDVVIWSTGFRPSLRHLAPLRLRGDAGSILTSGPSGLRSSVDPRVYLVGYGDWTGPASATLLGVGRTLRHLGDEVTEQLA